MKKVLFILLSIALLCSIMTIAVYADSEAIAQDTAATTSGEETSEAERKVWADAYRETWHYHCSHCLTCDSSIYPD